MQDIIVGIIGVVSLGFVVRGVVRSFRNGGGPCCGCDARCTNCSAADGESCGRECSGRKE